MTFYTYKVFLFSLHQTEFSCHYFNFGVFCFQELFLNKNHESETNLERIEMSLPVDFLNAKTRG